MLVSTLLRDGRQTLILCCRRNIGIFAPVAQKATDPIQQLFVEKLREYAQKCRSIGKPLVDASPEVEKEMKSELERVAKRFGGGDNVDMTKFPSFKFEDPKIDPIDLPKV